MIPEVSTIRQVDTSYIGGLLKSDISGPVNREATDACALRRLNLSAMLRRLWRGHAAKSQGEYRTGPGLHLGNRRSSILEYLPGEADRKEEDAARWKQKPTVALFASAPML
jgi:hypothetical protein